MSGDNGRATDKGDAEPEKNAVMQTVEATGRVLADGMVQVIQENRDQPYIYIPVVRRMLDALERVGSMPALGAQDLPGVRMGGAGAYGQIEAGLVPARGLRDDPSLAAVRGMIEAIQPIIDQALGQRRVPALRAVLESPLCSEEAKQRAADELSRFVMSAVEEEEETDAAEELQYGSAGADPQAAPEAGDEVAVIPHLRPRTP